MNFSIPSLLTKKLLGSGLPFLFLAVILFSCADSGKKNVVDSAALRAQNDLTDDARAWTDSVYASMTLDQKLAQLLMPAIYANADRSSINNLKWYARDLQVGSILLLKGSAEAAAAIADSLEAIRDSIPNSPGTFIAVDAETGLGMRFSDAPLFPWNSLINSDVDDQTFYDYGREVGREARIAGISMILGPVLDVKRDARKGGSIMKARSLGSDQFRVAELSLAYARGLESQGVASVLKHFPGHGPTTTDSHNILPRISETRAELDSIDLMPFRTAIENGLSCIMVGHIWAEALDTVMRPASFSPVVINDLLRKEMGFRGLVLVDAVGMGGAKGFSGVDAIIAGADIIIAPPDTKAELDQLRQAVNDGRLPMSRVEDAVKKILFRKYLQDLHSGSRAELESQNGDIKERLHQEAPDIINRLKGKAVSQ